MFYHLGNDPEVKQRCYAEIDELFSGKQPGELPSFSDIKGLRYLRMVLKETLRLYPGAPMRGRSAVQDDSPVESLAIEKDMIVVFDFLSCHLNPEYWPDPERFDPERFSEEQERLRPSHYFVPFGGGVRRCIGEQFAINEALTVTAVALRHLDVIVDPSIEIVREMTLTMRSKNPINVVFKAR